jgi:hypothetical protein
MILNDTCEGVELCWQGPENTSLIDDWCTSGEPDDDLRAHVVVCLKKIKLKQLLFELAAFAQIFQLFDKNQNVNQIHGVFCVIALTLVAPVSLHLVRDDEARLLAVIDRLQNEYIVNQAHLRALLRVQADADRLIEILIDKGFVRRQADGTLKVQRLVLTSLQVI